jgi:hypothetical protein
VREKSSLKAVKGAGAEEAQGWVHRGAQRLGREAVGAFYEQGREREVRIESVRDEQCGSREEKRIKL